MVSNAIVDEEKGVVKDVAQDLEQHRTQIAKQVGEMTGGAKVNVIPHSETAPAVQEYIDAIHPNVEKKEETVWQENNPLRPTIPWYRKGFAGKIMGKFSSTLPSEKASQMAEQRKKELGEQ